MPDDGAAAAGFGVADSDDHLSPVRSYSPFEAA